MSKVNTIENAMKNRTKIIITYADNGAERNYEGTIGYRNIAPLTLGTTSKGNMAIRCWDENRGDYRLFLIAHIGSILPQPNTFDEADYPLYKGTDKMLNIQSTVSQFPQQGTRLGRLKKAFGSISAKVKKFFNR